MLSANALYLLQQRYCLAGEKPDDVLKRVSKFLGNSTKEQRKIYNLMRNGIFFPNSPCLFNAGIPKGSLHACFTLGISDDIEGILGTLGDMVRIFRGGGGVGINFSPLRQEGAPLSSRGESSGVLSFMEAFDKMVEIVKQGGVRRGALMGILNYRHPDIFDFIKIKQTGKLQNFNLSVLVDDEFMEHVENGYSDIFDISCMNAWSHGDPGFLFFDRLNKDNPYYPDEILDTTNPCQPSDAILLDGDQLRVISGDGSNWKSWKTGTRNIIELTFNNGIQARFTPEHKIMLEDGNWTMAKDSIGKNIKWGLGSRESTHIDETYVLYGFLFGDGYKCANGEGCSVKINEEKEKEVAYMLRKFGFEKERCGAFYINKNKLSIGNSLPLCKLSDRDVPDDILFSESNISASFLRGLFEANGSVNRHGQISLKSTNLSMIKDVQLMLSSFGIPSWFVPNRPVMIHWKNGNYISRESYNLQIAPRNAWKFKETIGFISSTKISKIKQCNGEYKGKLKVTKISSPYLAEVWDYRMDKEPHHNFCQGVVASNCSEVSLPHNSACCLGSINISRFVFEDEFDFEAFRETCTSAMHILSSMNKKSNYPNDTIKDQMEKNDPVGVGIMGFADTLIMLGIKYDSQECLDFIDLLGIAYKEATDEDKEFHFYRRIIAPTGSLSILADCSSGIEPVYDATFKRNLTVGVVSETRELYKSKYLRTSHQVSPEWHVKVLAQWQKWVDGGVSKTVNMPKTCSVQDVRNVYLQAWKSGCKGITVYRDKSRKDQVLTSTFKPNRCEGENCTL